MTTYSTGNSIGSTDPRDLYDNAQNIDEWANSTEKLTHNDRLGVPRKTFHGMESQFNAAEADRSERFDTFLAGSAYYGTGVDGSIEDYTSGIEVTEYNQVIRADGELWRLSAQVDLPYVTTGAGMPESGAFVSAGDGVLRQELNDPAQGAAKIARGVVAVDSIADLLALSVGQRKESLQYVAKGYYAGTTAGGGRFYWNALSTAEPDGGTVLAVPGVATGRFRRKLELPVSIECFGVQPETPGAGDLIQKAINSVKHIHIPAKTYLDCHITMPAESSITGTGKRSVLRYPDPQTEGEGAPIMITASNCYVDGVMCDGNWDGASDLAPHISMNFEGINVKNASNTRIGEVWVRNCSGDGIDLDGGADHDIGTVHAENIGGSCVHPSYHEPTDTFASNVRIGKIIATNCGLFNNRQCLNVFGFSPQGGAKDVTVQNIYATNCYGLVGCSENTDNVHVVNAVGIDIGPLGVRECSHVILNARSRIDSLYMQAARRGQGGAYIRFAGVDCSIGHAIIRDGSRAVNAGLRTDAAAERASVGYFRISFDSSFGYGEGVGVMLRAPYGSVGKAIVEGASSNGARLLSNNCTIYIDTINCGQGAGHGAGAAARAGVWLQDEPGFFCHSNRVTTTAVDNQSTPTQQYGVFEDAGITRSNYIETGIYTGMVVADERLTASSRVAGVGAVALMAKTTAGAVAAGDLVPGSSLAPSNTAGTQLGSAPFGEWLALGQAGGSGSPAADRVSMFRRIR